MRISDILTPRRVRCDVDAGSKKRVLEVLGELLSSAGDGAVSPHAIFNCLFARERLGSTGLGEGVALPHGRIAELSRPIGAFIRTSKGVDFDAPDGVRVDLVFGLLVPEDSTDEHLQVLSQLAELFSDARLRRELRGAASSEKACELIAKFGSGLSSPDEGDSASRG